MIVVSDASPIISLAAIGQLSLLNHLYGKIIIPETVYRELVGAGDELPGAAEAQILHWIEHREVTNSTLAAALELELDEGEAAAIALAIELNADLVLLDERRGRKIAARLGLNYVGLLGALVEAKHKGLLPDVKPLLDELILRAGFWMSEELYAQVLRTAGE